MEKGGLASDQMMHVQNLGKVISSRLREDGICHGGCGYVGAFTCLKMRARFHFDPR